MSIIENAINKLQPGKAQGVKPVAESTAPQKETSSLIERAIESAMQPKVAPPEVPVEPIQEPAKSRHENINLAKLKKMGVITPDAERSKIAEEFRLIKRPLLANALGQGAAPIKNGNLIMVTSSLPGEGKSFCSINLAISIALEMDRTVLLVDADVARPRILEYLGLQKDSLGLLDVLRDSNLELADVLIRTNIEKLTILPAGQTYRHATELLASEAMDKLLEDMGNRYPDRIIIFDSPPLLSTSEASALATQMGQIVMVVEAEKTPEDAVKEALSRIESCDVIGMLLNKTAAITGSDYYGYYGS
ncbi:XrtA-associated tyrosine autokinase [Sulfurirhabdus autotrophica]|uniref:non-specific protein-tyrosine kinase n=1 Tax=Sulfurirhabdus autotrophica TaxID=1706046 RepID=A0A4R3Y8D2_9PROT|nr:XrtA-associated tyrosine autokinase [Sulfurirhabdus autotrophica]TCV88157.1 receptor protein-tyrosine kinase [Sulfurirhabdus autotrophica]